MIERLNWDSDFFGFEVGRINIKSKEQFNYELFIEKSFAFKLIYIFSDEKLNDELLSVIDTKLTFFRQININQVKDDFDDVNIKIFNKSEVNYEDYKKLEELALNSGEFSRFNLDQNFGKGAFESLYKKWISNIVYEEEIDVIIYEENSSIVGFTTLKKINDSLCDISLVAVNGSYRGKGIATKLINFTLKQALKRKFQFIQVVTQFMNKPAINLYQKCFFEVKNKQYIYHYWNL